MEPQDVQEGLVIVIDQGRRWDETLYPTENAAESTAAACVSGEYTIRRPKLVSHLRPSPATTSKPLGEWVVGD